MNEQEKKDLRNAREEFLIESLDFYTEDPNNLRASDINGGCTYSPKNKRGNQGCMIGRHLTPEQQNQGDDDTITGDTSWSSIVYHIDNVPDKLIYLKTDFLDNCQNLHDSNANWTSTGLTEDGKENVVKIINNYKLRKTKFPKRYIL